MRRCRGCGLAGLNEEIDCREMGGWGICGGVCGVLIGLGERCVSGESGVFCWLRYFLVCLDG